MILKLWMTSICEVAASWSQLCHISITEGSHSELVCGVGRRANVPRGEEHVKAADMVVPVPDLDVIHSVLREVH